MKTNSITDSKKDLKAAAALLSRRNLAYLDMKAELAMAGMNITVQPQISSNYGKIARSRVRRQSIQRRIVVIAATLILLLGMVLAVNAHVREMTLDFVRRVFTGEDRVSYEFFEGDNPEVTELPELHFDIPEGFEYVKGYRDPWNESSFYKNYETSNTLGIHYSLLNLDAEIGFEWDTQLRKTVYINGIEADLYSKGDRSNQNNLIWIDHDLGIIVTITSTVCEEEMIRIAESIYIKK